MLHDLTASTLMELLARRELTSLEVVEHFLARAEQDDCGAFVRVDRTRALERAAELDGLAVTAPLHGMPIADKDLQTRAGTVTTFGSRVFAEYVATESDEVVQACDAAGTVSLGKTATPEFGYAGYTSSHLHRHTTVPGHPGLGAGGSSGGAAAAVAAGMLPFAPGSDAAGSIRIPAAACGVVGFKPSRGAVLSPGPGLMGALVVPGVLARNVPDAVLLFTGLFHGHARPLQPLQPRLRIGILRDFRPWEPITDGLASPEATAALEAAAGALAAAGHEVVDLTGPELPGYAEAFQTLWHASTTELSLNEAQIELLEPLTKHFIDSGRALGAEAIAQASESVHQLGQRVRDAFSVVDVVVTPTTALTPRPVGWFTDDPETNFRRQCEYGPHTSFVNVAGLPAVSLPVTNVGDGLSMSVQLIGRHAEDAALVALAAELEQLVGR